MKCPVVRKLAGPMASGQLTLSSLLWNLISWRSPQGKRFAAVCIFFLVCNQPPLSPHLPKSHSFRRVTEIKKKIQPSRAAETRRYFDVGLGINRLRQSRKQKRYHYKALRSEGHEEVIENTGTGKCKKKKKKDCAHSSHLHFTPRKEDE